MGPKRLGVEIVRRRKDQTRVERNRRHYRTFWKEEREGRFYPILGYKNIDSLNGVRLRKEICKCFFNDVICFALLQ